MWKDALLLTKFDVKIAACTMSSATSRPLTDGLALAITADKWIGPNALSILESEITTRIHWPDGVSTVGVDCGGCPYERREMSGLSGVLATIAEVLQGMVGHRLNYVYVTRIAGGSEYQLRLPHTDYLCDMPVARTYAIDSKIINGDGLSENHWTNSMCKCVLVSLGETRDLRFYASQYRRGAAFAPLYVSRPLPTQQVFNREAKLVRKEYREVPTHAGDRVNVLSSKVREIGKISLAPGTVVALCGQQDFFIRQISAKSIASPPTYLLTFYFFRNPKGKRPF